MMTTWKANAQWAAANRHKVNEFVRQNGIATAEYIRRSRIQMAQMAQSNAVASDHRRTTMMGDWHERSMSAFNQRMAAKGDMTRKMQNYSLDQTDVTNGGQSWKVGSGYSHYYQSGQSNTIIGTNSASNPGPDFTPLEQY